MPGGVVLAGATQFAALQMSKTSNVHTKIAFMSFWASAVQGLCLPSPSHPFSLPDPCPPQQNFSNPQEFWHTAIASQQTMSQVLESTEL